TLQSLDSTIPVILRHRCYSYRGSPILPPHAVPLPSSIKDLHIFALSTPTHVSLYWLPLVLF
ncbi:hypothetical protein Gorai_002481, partial [Gossypium raimondii]|nr:hypothetical protein [Gossypium raimondii]